MPASIDKPQTEDGRAYLKMKDLVAATGVPKSTILLYVNTGLLPPPLRPQRNMAYYHPACVSRVAFIKEAQNRHRLPLAAIKGLLKEMDKGRDVTPLLELQTALFSQPDRKISRTAFCKATGLTDGQVADLMAARLLVPRTDDGFDAEDQAVGRLLRKGLDAGLEVADLAFYPVLAEAMVEKEITLRQKYTQPLAFEKDAALTLELARMARGLRAYVIDRIMQRRLLAFKGLKNSPDNPRRDK